MGCLYIMALLEDRILMIHFTSQDKYKNKTTVTNAPENFASISA